MTVNCMYRLTENDRQVVSVEELRSESWGKENDLETLKKAKLELFKIMTHNSCGSVEKIAGGIITLSFNGQKNSAELDYVDHSHVPKDGDCGLVGYNNEITNDNEVKIEILRNSSQSRSLISSEIIRCVIDFGVIKGDPALSRRSSFQRASM